MKILLTGSSGFIGKHIAATLSVRHTVLAPTHKQLDLLGAESAHRYFRLHPIDIVIHCAVVGGSRKEEFEKGMFYDNMRIFFNIVRCKKYFKRMINIGSGAEYDKRFPIVNIKEDALGKRVPIDEYGFYKYVCANYINESDNNIVDLRVFGMFGEGEDYRYRFISNAICRHLLGKSIIMNQDVYFDYMDIQDFIKIIEFFVAHKPKYKSYNIGTGKKINLKTVAKIINIISNTNRKIIIKKPSLNNEYTCNISQLREELPSLVFRDMNSSIKRLYDWYGKRIDELKASL